jgi:hypothetical protein
MKGSGRYIVVLSIGLLIGFCVGSNNQWQSAHAQGDPNTAGTRFQISAFGLRTDGGCYIIDTQTGALWLSPGGRSDPMQIADKMPPSPN